MSKLFTFFVGCVFLPVVSFAAPASESCENILKNLGSDWSYDKVNVPVDWNKSTTSPTIDVYYYFRNVVTVKDKTPIVFMNGGPTVAGARATKMFNAIPLLQDQNIIVMDQRGTGCSVGFPLYSPQMDFSQYQKFSSDSIVKDAEVIRKKMFGDGKWKVYGQSFGGLISFRYLEMFPESIHSAHIHGFGFWSKPEELLDRREKKLLEVSEGFFSYSNPQVSSKTAGELIQSILNSKELPAGKAYAQMCIKTPGSRQDEFCGYDLIPGLYLTVGFKNFWPVAYDTVFKIDSYIQTNNVVELEKIFIKFSENNILRFNDPNQAATLQVITYNEIMPGRLFTDGCASGVKNPIISECYIDENFLMPVVLDPPLKLNPVKLAKVRNNIKRWKVPVYYYGGAWDSFMPVDIVRWTADQLDIKNQLVIFPDSGHEGYYTETLLLQNLVGK